ncbi:hypothetical protein MCUN1_001618 [Malassezia cuniculi]|uniref:RING-type domain-containing protein n=1 Tax=Malassezia cuniculi TaxID=948313 RepID=A0AAF0EUF8_9BASI|nr:hypothetical protein MCUN1_001618 [Malassezia cuniculi]
MLRDQWGSRRKRLGAENLRSFDACCLCLQRAQRPVCDSHGHLFCKECVLSDLITQKSNLAKADKQRAHAEKVRAEQAKEAERDAAAAKIADFEKGSKRAHTEEDEASKKRRRDGANPAFWLPALAPGVDMDEEQLRQFEANTPPRTPLCLATDKPHPLTSKQLVDIVLSVRKVGVEEQLFCPSCKKQFTASSHIHVIRGCGHAFCAPCATTLVKQPLDKGEAGSCPECSTDIPSWARHVVAIAREGTGYAGGGVSETATKGVAFQG